MMTSIVQNLFVTLSVASFEYMNSGVFLFLNHSNRALLTKNHKGTMPLMSGTNSS